MSKHPNHEIIRAYSEDTSLVIERYYTSDEWKETTFESFMQFPSSKYRIKPKPEFVTVGRHTWSMPITMKDVPDGSFVWGFNPAHSCVQEVWGQNLIKHFVNSGFAHLTEAEAITHMNAIIAISKGDID